MKLLTRQSAVVGVAALAAIAWACDAPDRHVAPPEAQGGQLAAFAKGGRAIRQPSAHVRSVAEIHNRAMLRFFGNLDSYIGKRGHRTEASRCAGLRRLTREALHEAAVKAGTSENPAIDNAVADEAIHGVRPSCGVPAQASLFIPASVASGDDIVTAAAVPYLEALQSGYSSMPDPFAGTVAAVNANVLAAAAGESQENYDAIYMTAQFALDDAALWVSIGEEFGDAAFCDAELNPEQCADPPDEMTLFAPKNPWVLRGLLGMVYDLGGCITAELVDAGKGTVTESDMYRHCAVAGLGASIAYGINVLNKDVEIANKLAKLYAK